MRLWLVSLRKIVVASVLITVVLTTEVGSTAQIAQSPSVVSAFLKVHPEYRLLKIEDVPEDLRPTEAEVGVSFSAFAEAELTGDRQTDIVAVLVRERPSLRYSVVAFHQTSSGRYSPAVWLIRDDETRLLGIYVREKRRVIPAECIECDSNPFWRWNGTKYELQYWLPGEQPSAHGHTRSDNNAVSLRASPSEDGREVARLPDCTTVTIEQAQPKVGTLRWYRVRAQTQGGSIQGFLRSNSLTEIGCLG
jgi:hypothetical protein